MILHNTTAYNRFSELVDRFTLEQGIYPRFSLGGTLAEFDMEEGYTYFFQLIGDLKGALPHWKVIEGVKEDNEPLIIREIT